MAPRLFAPIIASTLLLLGCGSGIENPTAQPDTPVVPPLAVAASLTGNWHIMLQSEKMPSEVVAFMGGLTSDSDLVSGTVQMWGKCFYYDHPTFVQGYHKEGALTLTGSVYGQLVKLTGQLDRALTNLTGRYTIEGGCTGSDSGTLIGMRVPDLSGLWSGTLISWFSPPSKVASLQLYQASVGRGDGWFDIEGTARFTDTGCFENGTVKGKVMGRILILEVTSTTSSDWLRIVAHTNDFGTQAGDGARPLTGWIMGSDNHYIYFGGMCDSDEGTLFIRRTP